MKRPDYSKLDDDFKQKLQSIKGQPVEEQLEDIKTTTMRGFRALAQEMKLSEASQGDIINKMGELLAQSQKALTELLKRPEAEMPDNKPMIKAINTGFNSLRAELGKIDVKPEVNVDIPEIKVPEITVPKSDPANVDVTVDTDAVASILSTELPVIFQEIADSIPENDYSELQKAVDKSNSLLEDVRRNTALKASSGGGGSGGGDASAANQTTIIGHVDGIEGLLGTISSNQLADGHNVTIDNASIAVTGTFWQTTQPVSGTVTANLSSTDNAVLDSIKVDTEAIETAVEAIQAAQLPDGHNVTIDNGSIAVTGTFFPATQPVSAASLPLPSGAATAANQQTDALTDTQLRASAVTMQPEVVSSANTTTGVTVGSTSTSVLTSNASRVEMIIVNDSDEEVYLNLSGTAVMNEGIRLNADGGSFVTKAYSGAVTAICSSGGKVLTVTEL